MIVTEFIEGAEFHDAELTDEEVTNIQKAKLHFCLN